LVNELENSVSSRFDNVRGRQASKCGETVAETGIDSIVTPPDNEENINLDRQ